MLKQYRDRLLALRMIIGLILLTAVIFQLISNLSKGYIFFPPFTLESPPVFEVFHSAVENISIAYPKEWITRDFAEGSHGDDEIIASIGPHYYDYPYVTIAHLVMPNPSLEKVANWGEQRIKSNSYESFFLDEINITGKPALLRTYSRVVTLPIIKSQKRINCYHVYVIDGNDTYTIELCVDEENYSDQMRAVFEQMIKSISFS